MHNERLHAFYSSNCCHLMKEDETDEACSPQWREEKCIQNFDSEACRKVNASKSRRRCEKNIRIVPKKPDGRVWTGFILLRVRSIAPTPVAARSKAWVCGHSVAGVVGSNPAGCMDVFLLCGVR